MGPTTTIESTSIRPFTPYHFYIQVARSEEFLELTSSCAYPSKKVAGNQSHSRSTLELPVDDSSHHEKTWQYLTTWPRHFSAKSGSFMTCFSSAPDWIVMSSCPSLTIKLSQNLKSRTHRMGCMGMLITICRIRPYTEVLAFQSWMTYGTRPIDGHRSCVTSKYHEQKSSLVESSEPVLLSWWYQVVLNHMNWFHNVSY